jgi:3-oxoacyl-[acyl-carrier-protein] synthase-3
MKIGITGTGGYIPTVISSNEDFSSNDFLNSDGTPFLNSNATIIEKFEAITGIGQRRYADKKFNTSDLAFFAAQEAISDSGVDPELLDYIIVAHNFGDIAHGQSQGDTVPSLASRVKHRLGIVNPNCVGYDILFGCPGWIQGLIQAHAFILAGLAKRCLVIGAETLSRVIDKSDRDSMIYSDGAGACILEAGRGSGEILGHVAQTFAREEAYYLFYGESYDSEAHDNRQYIKMYGRKIYEFAVTHVPAALKECLEKCGVAITEVNKIFLHQANEKMDEAIVTRFYGLYGLTPPEGIMPMNIHTMGNSSVATVPTLFDMVRKGALPNQSVAKGDVVIFASVGAGMNINALVYRI